MNIGSLYKVKECFWLLFPTKETALAPAAHAAAPAAAATNRPVDDDMVADAAASYWSKRFKCEVTYFSSDSIVVFLEEDGVFKKLLTADGKIGWTWFDENYNDCFEEVKSE